ncbi:MAG: hypothetical protein COA82_07005 [Alkaliphilus sp.]|nr:AAA family ATPase [bacterium AH-315-K05]PHS34830.1 MAG: hypothetical protein COA82_07005 [Alkaliphilus sp.]
MPIDKVRIRNYKSLTRIDIDVNNSKYNLQCFLGKNGSGKTHILNALKYFFDILADSSKIGSAIDSQNPYIQKMEIEIIFNFSELEKKADNDYK